MASEKLLIVTSDNFEEMVLKNELPVLVDFWAPWCGPCRMVGPIVDELATEYEGRAVIGKLNVDEEPDLAARYKVMSIPTLLLFKGGEVAEKLVGARPKADMAAMIDKSL